MYDNDKDAVIRIRLSQQLKDTYQQCCKQKAINPSELLRQLIIQWVEQQQK